MKTGKWITLSVIVLFITAMFTTSNAFGVKVDEIQFPNQGFEEDAALVGWPDHWKQLKGVKGESDRTFFSEGGKSLKFTQGKLLLSHTFSDIQGLANHRVVVSADIAGVGEQVFIQLFWKEKNADGKVVSKKASYDCVPKKEFSTYQLNAFLPENTVDGELTAQYRKRREGTVWLDNLDIRVFKSSNKLSKEEDVRRVELTRDLRYIRQKVKRLGKTNADLDAAIAAYAKKVEEICDTASLKAVEGSSDTGNINAMINRLRCGEQTVSWIADAFARQDPAGLIPKPAQTEIDILALSNEYQALGALVANTSDKVKTVAVVLSGFGVFADELVVRRQVFHMNWYTKHDALTGDALTQLLSGKKDGTYMLSLDPGDIVRLYVGFKTKRKAGSFPVSLMVGDRKLSATVEVARNSLPDEEFGHWPCIYLVNRPLSFRENVAKLMARDLASHYVTAPEFTGYINKYLTFDDEGNLLESKLEGSPYDKMFTAFAKEGLSCELFTTNLRGGPEKNMGGNYKFKRYDKKNPNVLTPEFKRMYGNRLRAWRDLAEKRGYPDKATIMIEEEVNSGKDYADAPSAYVRRVRDACDTAKEYVPEMRRSLAIYSYTMPADFDVLLGGADVMISFWPTYKELGRYAPKGYNPRQVFNGYMLPRMKHERDRRGLKLWSYFVNSGLSTGPDFQRLYPLSVAGIDIRGIGYWAYQCPDGSTWDEANGRIYDACFIRDGQEDHPDCKKYNVTREIIVPSIRWEALRMGIQDAKLFLYLRDNLKQLSPEARAEMNKILTRCKESGLYHPEKALSHDEILKFSKAMRRIYAATK